MAGWERLSAIVLAAGFSRRAAPHNKLLLPFGSGTVVRALVEAMCGAPFGEVIVVTGHDAERIREALRGLPARIIRAPEHVQGMGASLAAGVRAAARAAVGFAVTPADLPELTPSLVETIGRAFLAQAAGVHIVPTAQGQRGHPVMLAARLRGELEALTGDHGARGLLARDAERGRTHFLEVADPAIWRDVDAGRAPA